MGSLIRAARAGNGPLIVLLALCGCASPVRIGLSPGAGAVSVRRLALVPPRAAPLPDTGPGGDRGTIEGDGVRIVGSRVFDAIERAGVWETIPSEEVRRALELAGLEPLAATPGEVCRSAHRKFGAQGVLFTTVRRFRARKGGAQGALRPASVRFELELRGPAGGVLWEGEYDETQQGFTDDPLGFRRSLSRRFRWVTAEALAAYGARELVDRMPGR